jgi:hypothetical protein
MNYLGEGVKPEMISAEMKAREQERGDESVGVK